MQRKIDTGEIVGVNGCILASSPAYDDVLNTLKVPQSQLAEAVVPLTGKLFLS